MKDNPTILKVVASNSLEDAAGLPPDIAAIVSATRSQLSEFFKGYDSTCLETLVDVYSPSKGVTLEATSTVFRKLTFIQISGLDASGELPFDEQVRVINETEAWVEKLYATAARKSGIDRSIERTFHILPATTILFEPLGKTTAVHPNATTTTSTSYAR